MEEGETLAPDPPANDEHLLVAPAAPAPSASAEGLKAFARARKYQRELFEAACKSNVVAFLDTGAGKTLISVMLIRQKMDELTDNTGPGKRLTVFLAPKVDLVIQQAQVIRFHTSLQVGHYVGSMGVDFWNLQQWLEQFAKQDVLVMTYQILLNILQAAFITLDKIHLLVVDECHHVRKGNAVNIIMQEYYHNPEVQGRRPHVFGMTASPLDQKSSGMDRTRAFFDELESNMAAKVMTVADRTELESVVPRPTEQTLPYPGTVVNAAIYEGLVQLQGICRRLEGTSNLVQQQMQVNDQRRAGLDSLGIAMDREKRSTESGAWARSLQGIGHILETLGPFCATVALKEVLTPSSRRNRMDKLAQQSSEALKLGAFLDSDSEDELNDLSEDVWWVGAAKALPLAPCNADEAAALVEACTAAAQLFSDLMLSHLPFKPKIAAVVQLEGLRWAEARQRIVEALNQALLLIPPQRLELDVDATIAAMQRTGPGVPENASTMAPLVSPKAAMLVCHLGLYKDLAEAPASESATSAEPPWSGIVFAKRRLAVVALHRLVDTLPRLSFLRSRPIMGHGGRLAATSLTTKKQQEVLLALKRGELNLLLSTSVTEEGLDLTRCRLVVRFDLPDRPVDYIQSRGRARARNSRMVLMVEDGNVQQQTLIDDVRRCEDQMRAEALRRRLEESRRVHYEDSEDSNDEGTPSQPGLLGSRVRRLEYCVHSTGARVSLSNAKSLLFDFCHKLPSDRYASGVMRPRFSTRMLSGPPSAANPESEFQHSMPGSALLPNALPNGHSAGRSRHAHHQRQAAHTAAIGKKRKRADLSATKGRKALRTASAKAKGQTFIRAKQKSCFQTQIFLPNNCPVQWAQGIPQPKRSLAVGAACVQAIKLLHKAGAMSDNLADLDTSRELGQALGLLVPRHLPQDLPSFALPLLGGIKALGTLVYMGPIHLTGSQITQVLKFHNSMCKSSSHHKPSSSGSHPAQREDIADERVPVNVTACKQESLAAFLEDAILVTTYDHSMYMYRGMEYGMCPSMLMPADARPAEPAAGSAAEAANARARALGTIEQMTFLEYYRKRWNITDIDPTQPLVRVLSKDSRFTDAQNGNEGAGREKHIYLIPQLVRVHPLRAGAVGAGKRLLPRLLWQVHMLVLAAELRTQLMTSMQSLQQSSAAIQPPSLDRMVEALTPQSCQEQHSYERLENLGDAFIKYSTCLSLFTTFPRAHEGQLTARKDRLVSNENLARIGLRLGLEAYIALPWKAYSFPDGCLAVQGRHMRIKVVADCVEALVGAFFIEGGEPAGFAFVCGALGLLPPLPPLPPPQDIPSDVNSQSLRGLEEVLGWSFRDARLAREACTHCSWPDSACPSYQRLEFLGDALIDLCVTRYFVTTFRNVTPGRMHDLRSASVNNTRMSCAAASRRLHTFLRYMSSQLFGDITRFMGGLHAAVKRNKATLLEANNVLLRLGLHGGAEDEKRRAKLTLEAKRKVYDQTVVEAGFGECDISGAPKVLGDIVESLAAAVYLDAGRDLEAMWRIFGDMLSPLPKPDTVPLHPVRDLLERANQAGLSCRFLAEPCARDGSTSIVAVVDGKALARSDGAPNIKTARLLAARAALENWKDAPALRTRY
ncbi:hypothetical protein WJX73_008442 [Symbiochloris irregularis]|uniref:Dicer-like protein 1 n=1 Tax=Symbiochloris irregularis TaxID=706552 RepID=A0AAW1PAD7_9CHLO